jgi:preprotein translocase subunit Sec61beta
MRRDAVTIKPHQVVVVGVVLAAVLVVSLLFLVRMITRGV